MNKSQVQIIFDLDGTLIDSKDEILSAYAKVLLMIPSKKHFDLNKLNLGLPLVNVLNSIYETESDILRAKMAFANCYDNSEFQETKLYPGVKPLLTNLKSEGYLLSIATNKRIIPTKSILKKKGLIHFFDEIQTSDKSEQIQTKTEMVKRLATRSNIELNFMVGDSVQDIEAGKASNTITIGALYGYENKSLLLQSNPDFLVNNVPELENIILCYEQAK